MKNGGIPDCPYRVGPLSSALSFFFLLLCLLQFHHLFHQHPSPGGRSTLGLIPTSLCTFSRYAVGISLPVPQTRKYQSSHGKVQKREGTVSSTRHALNSNIHIFVFLIYRELYVNSIGVSVSAAGYAKGFPSPFPRGSYRSRLLSTFLLEVPTAAFQAPGSPSGKQEPAFSKDTGFSPTCRNKDWHFGQ